MHVTSGRRQSSGVCVRHMKPSSTLRAAVGRSGLTRHPELWGRRGCPMEGSAPFCRRDRAACQTPRPDCRRCAMGVSQMRQRWRVCGAHCQCAPRCTATYVVSRRRVRSVPACAAHVPQFRTLPRLRDVRKATRASSTIQQRIDRHMHQSESRNRSHAPVRTMP